MSNGSRNLTTAVSQLITAVDKRTRARISDSAIIRRGATCDYIWTLMKVDTCAARYGAV